MPLELLHTYYIHIYNRKTQRSTPGMIAKFWVNDQLSSFIHCECQNVQVWKAEHILACLELTLHCWAHWSCAFLAIILAKYCYRRFSRILSALGDTCTSFVWLSNIGEGRRSGPFSLAAESSGLFANFRSLRPDFFHKNLCISIYLHCPPRVPPSFLHPCAWQVDPYLPCK